MSVLNPVRVDLQNPSAAASSTLNTQETAARHMYHQNQQTEVTLRVCVFTVCTLSVCVRVRVCLLCVCVCEGN